MNMTLRTVNVAICRWLPWIDYKTGEAGKIFDLRGIMKDVLKITEEILRVRFEYREPPDGSWGKQLSDGSFSGMVGMVFRNECELAVGPFTITEDRFLAVQFTTPLYTDHVAILDGHFGKDYEAMNISFRFFKTFENANTINDSTGYLVYGYAEHEYCIIANTSRTLTWAAVVWICIIFSLFACVFPVSLGYFFTKQSYSQGEIFTKTFEFFLIFWGALLGQAQDLRDARPVQRETKARPDLKLMGIWLLTSAILMEWCFSGQVLSTLVVRKPQDVIDELHDFPRFPEVTPLLEKGTSLESFLEKSDFSDAKELWRTIQKNPSTSLMRSSDFAKDATLDRVQTGLWAALSDRITLTSILVNRKSRKPYKFALNDIHLFKNFAMAIGRQLPADTVRKISSSVSCVTSGGLINKFISADSSRATPCLVGSLDLRPGGSTQGPLRFAQLDGVFFLLSLGLSCAFTVFGIEVIFKRRTIQIRQENCRTEQCHSKEPKPNLGKSGQERHLRRHSKIRR